MSPTRLASLLAAVAGLAVGTVHAEPLGTAFTYQGELQDAGAPASGVFDLEFAAYTQLDGGTAVQTLCADDVAVANGRFTVLLDFGALPASRVWLGLRVRAGAGKVCGDASGFTALLPRQEITPTPMATYASKSGAADTLNGHPASFYTDANNLSAGTISNARLSPTVARTDIPQTFTGAVSFTNVTNIAGNGAGLLALNASNLLSGTVADARLSANVPKLNAPNTFTETNTMRGVLRLDGAPGVSSPLEVISRSDNSTRVISQFVDYSSSGSLLSSALMTGDGEGITITNPKRSLSFGASSTGSWPVKNLTIASTGRVGIGSNNPGTKLSIEGTDAVGAAYDAAISLKNTAPSGGYWSMNSLANPNPGIVEPGSMAMYNNNGLYAMLTQSGKLGLNGVFNPQATLDVNGQIYSRTGGIKFPDGSVQMTAVGPTPSPGAANGVAEFPSNTTWIVPTGVTRVIYDMWGGGGGGANGPSGGGGGGSGAYRRGVLNVAPGQVITIVIGVGGYGRRFGDPGAGGDGGITSIIVPGSITISADCGKGGGAANVNGLSAGGRGGGAGSGSTSIGRPGREGESNDVANGWAGSRGIPPVTDLLPSFRANASDSYYTYRASGGFGSRRGSDGSDSGCAGFMILS